MLTRTRNRRLARIVGASTLAVALAGPPLPAAAQRASSSIISQGVVDGVARALLDASPRPGDGLVSRVVESDAFVARVAGTQVAVSTRFLAEASRDALAAALARDLFPDLVLTAIVLDRAGFDGPAGLGQLHDRSMIRLMQESRHLTSVDAAYRNLQAVLAVHGHQAAAPEGFQVMAGARIRAAEATYRRAGEAYRIFLLDQARFLAMAPVSAEVVRAVAEITAVLRGFATSDSPWGPRIRSTLESFPRPGAPLPR
jgi:hypothetical protein